MDTIATFVTPKGEEMVILPKGEFDKLSAAAEAAEDALDAAEADRVIEGIRKGEIETFPDMLVSALLDGESPVKLFRKHRGMTGQQLADAAGLSQAYISQIENGSRDGTVKQLGAIANALGLTVDDLIWDQE